MLCSSGFVDGFIDWLGLTALSTQSRFCMTSTFHAMGPIGQNQARRWFVEFTGHHSDVNQCYVWSRSPDGGTGGEVVVYDFSLVPCWDHRNSCMYCTHSVERMMNSLDAISISSFERFILRANVCTRKTHYAPNV